GRSEIDDSPGASLTHLRHDGTGRKERPGQVDTDLEIPVRERDLVHGIARDCDPGAVDEDVDPVRLIESALDALLIRDVERLEAQSLFVRERLLLIKVADGHVDLVVDQPTRDGRPDPLCSSGDERAPHTAVKPPSQATAEPTKNEASSLRRKAVAPAISRGSAKRPIG